MPRRSAGGHAGHDVRRRRVRRVRGAGLRRCGRRRTTQTDHINLLFNNAGIGGGGSFVLDERDDWERTFNICWGGVYLCTRTFMPMLLASTEGHVVNTSSVNGFWASLGLGIPHTAYSAAKFAVKGFTEALITDFRLNAPHLRASVVMPGHIGTSIVINSGKVLGREPKELTAEQIAELRTRLERSGIDVGGASDDDIRLGMQLRGEMFRDNAPTTAAQAATVILDGVRANEWRILVGDDAVRPRRVGARDAGRGLRRIVRRHLEGTSDLRLRPMTA